MHKVFTFSPPIDLTFPSAAGLCTLRNSDEKLNLLPSAYSTSTFKRIIDSSIRFQNRMKSSKTHSEAYVFGRYNRESWDFWNSYITLAVDSPANHSRNRQHVLVPAIAGDDDSSHSNHLTKRSLLGPITGLLGSIVLILITNNETTT